LKLWESAEELPSDLHHPPVTATVDSLRAHFASKEGRSPKPLRNPHRELDISAADRARAKPAAVLIPIVERSGGLTLLLTRRHDGISFGGHLCFPGGRPEAGDMDTRATALRETQEEIGLEPRQVEVLGELGGYVSKNGYAIATSVGLVRPPLELSLNPKEVEEVIEIPLDYALRSDSYRLASRDPEVGWAIYFLQYGETIVTGPTISLMIGLYEALLDTHRSAE